MMLIQGQASTLLMNGVSRGSRWPPGRISTTDERVTAASAKPAASDQVGHTLVRPDIPPSDLMELARPDTGMSAT